MAEVKSLKIVSASTCDTCYTQQMAEMYGELMELNDRLHRELAEKEAIVQQLSRQLQSRGISLTGVPPSLTNTVHRSL